MRYSFTHALDVRRTCKLESGNTTEYHACCKGDSDPDSYSNMRYIGSGVIESIGGYMQSGSDKYRFYVRKS